MKAADIKALVVGVISRLGKEISEIIKREN
jgi:hypothetical protein